MTAGDLRQWMRDDIVEYRKRAHRTRKHARLTLSILSKLWKRARRENKDLWEELTKYEHPTLGEYVHGRAIKGAFRDFLLRKQQGRCCYCRCWLLATASARPIEHILPRNSYRRFSLDFWNLAVACVDCNLSKTKHVWGSIPTGAIQYPSGNHFPDMYHPRFHPYNEHVRYVLVETNGGGIALYRGLTPQGKHLCMNLLDKIATKRALLNNNPGLKQSLNDIDDYRTMSRKLGTPQLDALAKLLDTRLMEIVQAP